MSRTVEEIKVYLERQIEFWELAKKAAGDRTHAQLQKIALFQLAHRATLAFIDGESYTTLPPEFNPEQWTKQVSRRK